MPPYAWGFPFGGNFTGLTDFYGHLRGIGGFTGVYGFSRARVWARRGYGIGRVACSRNRDVVTGLVGGLRVRFSIVPNRPVIFFFTGAALPVVEKRNGLPCCRQLRPFITGIEGLRVGPCEPTLDPHFSLRATFFLTGFAGFFSKIFNSE